MAKSLLIVLAVLSVAGLSAAGGDPAAMEKIAEKCREGTSITKDMVATLVKNDMDSSAVDQATKCYFKCLLQTVGLMHTDGKIELDAAHQHFSDCAHSAMDSDICEKSFNFHRCIHNQYPDLPVF